jgi:putative tricarboxylic transport membrane protein
VGNHINATVNNPAEQMGFWQAGKVRPIVAFTPERLAVFPDVPTARELGHDIVYWMQRSFVAPKDMPAEAVEYYTEMLEQLGATSEWQEYASGKALVADMLTGDALQNYFLNERSKHAEILASIE